MKGIAHAAVTAALVFVLAASAVAENKATYEELIQKASGLRLSGHPEEAKTIYNDILARNPDDVDALVGRGFCRLAQKDSLDKAMGDFNNAIELAPAYVDAYVGLAIAHKRNGDRVSALAALKRCEMALAGEEEKLRYLAESSWREGHLRFARSLDKQYPPVANRKLIDYPNEISLAFTSDWLERGADWDAMGLTYVRRHGPDLTWWVSHTLYGRYGENDSETGIGLTYRYSRALSFTSETYISDPKDFLAEYKYKVKVDWEVYPAVILGLGADFTRYGSDWAETGRLELTRYMGRFHGKYALLAGSDNNGESVSTSIFEVGCEKELRYSIRLGYATGNESVEQSTGTNFSADRIDTVFGSFRRYVNPTWGFILGGAYEWRNDDPFRKTGSVSLFKRF